MGGMLSENGSSLQYESLQLASQIVTSIVKTLKELPLYQELFSIFSNDKVDLYLEK